MPLRFLTLLLLFTSLSTLSAAERLAVTDYSNTEVALSQPAKRIVSLSPHITENLFSIGAGAQVVATVDYSDYPEQAKNIPRVGGFNLSSVEQIIAYEPDLVVFWGSGNSSKILRQLRSLNIPVYVDEPKVLEDIAESLIELGKLSGHEEQGLQQAEEFLSRLNNLRDQHLSEKPLSVFYQIWDEPLQSLNGSHITSSLITLCGGKNIYADAATIAPVISKESVFERDPDVILSSGSGNARPGWLDDWLAYPQLTAVKNKRLYFISADLSQRHTLRILEGAEQLCALLKR